MNIQINSCITPRNHVTSLTYQNIRKIVDTYVEDLAGGNIERTLLCADDLDTFFDLKYPILRLGLLNKSGNMDKEIYIVTSLMLYHSCVNSKSGVVHRDIWEKMDKVEQEAILKFCERLSDVEVTINNVNTCILDACESLFKSVKSESYAKDRLETIKGRNSNMIDTESSESIFNLSHLATKHDKGKIMFKSSITVLPSVVTDQNTSFVINAKKSASNNEMTKLDEPYIKFDTSVYNVKEVAEPVNSGLKEDIPTDKSLKETPTIKEKIMSMKKGRGLTRNNENRDKKGNGMSPIQKKRWRMGLIICCTCLLILLVVTAYIAVPLAYKYFKGEKKYTELLSAKRRSVTSPLVDSEFVWDCRNNVCVKININEQASTNGAVHTSLSRCTLLCGGPPLWPYPVGHNYFSKNTVAVTTRELKYKFVSTPSEAVTQYLSEAFKLFLADLARLEKVKLGFKKESAYSDALTLSIRIEIVVDPDPKLRIDTDESYKLKIETTNRTAIIELRAKSFCGLRHSLETLSQLILVDQSSGYFILYSKVLIKDAPSYRYRGLMVDTARNFIPIPNIMKTLDAMATCKLNTFHWRISDVTSFPLKLEKIPYLMKYGAYDMNMVYTKSDVEQVVKRASVRGIRVLMEVAAPGPVGRAWTWSPNVGCVKSNTNYSCDNVLCERLNMDSSSFDILEKIYKEIIDMTKVDDVFHLSDGIFSIVNCYGLLEDREGFLEKALERLKLANRGFLPKLPIIWYTDQLKSKYSADLWSKLGVQINEKTPFHDKALKKFRTIFSTKWDLSCQMKNKRCHKYWTWQEMYNWVNWKQLDVLTIEGGEAIIWTDIVDSDGLETQIWPRAAAMAERLWSDIAVNATINPSVYLRMDSHRWRMVSRGFKVNPILPIWCSFNPDICLRKVMH